MDALMDTKNEYRLYFVRLGKKHINSVIRWGRVV